MSKKTTHPEPVIELRNERINPNDQDHRRRVQQVWRDVQSLQEKTVAYDRPDHLRP